MIESHQPDSRRGSRAFGSMSLRFAIVISAVIFASCQSAPNPAQETRPDSATPEEVSEPVSLGMVTVDASALNMRSEPSMDGEILAQIKRGGRLQLLEVGDSWMKVELPDGRTAWAASRFLLREGEKPRSRARRSGCPPDSDFAFETAPTPAFSDSDQSGVVVVEALVSASGKVKSTKVITNTTGDEGLAAQAEREIRSAEFIAPVRNCRSREFIYSYTRKF